ncbi:MAG: amino acid permease [Rhodopirellula sp.]|nr:amino acid permease [Rhodopirellula sp.]
MKPTFESESLITEPSTGSDSLAERLSLWDTVSIIVGIVVGTAVFRTPTMVFQNVAGPWQALGVWLLGGVLCVFGAFCYAELATTYPRNGGDYEYLSRAYGRWVGFLFGWAQLSIILTGSIGVMAYAFADYAAGLWNLPFEATPWVAASAVMILTLLNLFGLFVGKSLQNLLTGAKVLGLAVVVIAGAFWGRSDVFLPGRTTAGLMGPGLGLALVFVLYAYGGWNDAVFVAAEVRDQRRNLPRALILGIAGITVVYLAVNAAYLAVLGFDAARETATPAADVLALAVGPMGGRAVSLLVMISALGAINGMILAGSRVYAVVGEDHRGFAWLGHRSAKSGSPVASLLAQAAIALLLIFLVGTPRGRNLFDAALGSAGLGGLPWDKYFGGFETLLAGSAPYFWVFFLLTGLSLFVLRVKDRGRERGFSVPWYPLPPIIFSATCIYMLHSSLDYAGSLALVGAAPLLAGLPLYGLSVLLSRRGGS